MSTSFLRRICLAVTVMGMTMTGPTANAYMAPKIEKTYVFTGECWEYGTLVTTSSGEQHFWPASLTTKVNGYPDVCPGEDEGYA